MSPRDDDAHERLPRDGRDTAEDGEPVRDRPGGPALDGMAVVGPGQVAPAPDDEDTPEEDEAVADRRAHLQESTEGDGGAGS